MMDQPTDRRKDGASDQSSAYDCKLQRVKNIPSPTPPSSASSSFLASFSTHVWLSHHQVRDCFPSISFFPLNSYHSLRFWVLFSSALCLLKKFSWFFHTLQNETGFASWWTFVNLNIYPLYVLMHETRATILCLVLSYYVLMVKISVEPLSHLSSPVWFCEVKWQSCWFCPRPVMSGHHMQVCPTM